LGHNNYTENVVYQTKYSSSNTTLSDIDRCNSLLQGVGRCADALTWQRSVHPSVTQWFYHSKWDTTRLQNL